MNQSIVQAWQSVMLLPELARMVFDSPSLSKTDQKNSRLVCRVFEQASAPSVFSQIYISYNVGPLCTASLSTPLGCLVSNEAPQPFIVKVTLTFSRLQTFELQVALSCASPVALERLSSVRSSTAKWRTRPTDEAGRVQLTRKRSLKQLSHAATVTFSSISTKFSMALSDYERRDLCPVIVLFHLRSAPCQRFEE